jgi:hypothetical protein
VCISCMVEVDGVVCAWYACCGCMCVARLRVSNGCLWLVYARCWREAGMLNIVVRVANMRDIVVFVCLVSRM